MAKTDPADSPASWTLKFKWRSLTILLFSEALTPFSYLKTELISTLRDRYPAGLPRGEDEPTLPLPDSIDEVSLGILVDPFEPDKGWTELSKSMANIKESPKSLGLKDGAIIAFAFPEGDGDEKTSEFVVNWSTYDDDYAEEGGVEEALVEEEWK